MADDSVGHPLHAGGAMVLLTPDGRPAGRYPVRRWSGRLPASLLSPLSTSQDPASRHWLAVLQIVQILHQSLIKSLRTRIHRIVRSVLDGYKMRLREPLVQ